MGQGYSSLVRDGDALLDQGKLDEAEAKYLLMASQETPQGASDETLLVFARCKMEACMNLSVISMCRGNQAQSEKYMGEATQLEIKHSDSQRQHHVNTLAVFYLAAMSCIAPKQEGEHLLQRVVTSAFVSRALEARSEHAMLILCAQAWLHFRLARPSPVVLAPLWRAEPLATRPSLAEPTSHLNTLTPTINFEVDGELEGVDLDHDEDDDIGDLPSDDEDDSAPPTPHSPNPDANSNGNGPSSPQLQHHSNWLETKSRRPNPNLELVKSIVLTAHKDSDLVQIQALAQAARAMAIETQKSVFNGEHTALYTLWRNRGRIFHLAGNHQASLVSFMIALASNWTLLEAWVDLAQAYSNGGHEEKARFYLSILTDVIAPNDSIGWLERSKVCMKVGRFTEAAMCCDRVTLDIDPLNVEAWQRRAFATLQLRRWNSRAVQETLQITDSGLNIDGFHLPTLRTKAQALIEHGRYSEALSALNLLLTRDPSDVEAMNAKAIAHRHTQQYTEAVAWHKKAMAADPRSPDLVLHLALCYFQMATNLPAYHSTSGNNVTAATAASSSSSSSSSGVASGASSPAPTPIQSPTPHKSSGAASAASSAATTPAPPHSSSATPNPIFEGPTSNSSSSSRNSPALNGNGNGNGNGVSLASGAQHQQQQQGSSDSPSSSLRSSGILSNSMSCDPSLMPDGTFVGTLPFNQADAVEFPNMLTVMAHLHTTPRAQDVAHGLEATELALEVASRNPDYDGPMHFFFEPSALPRTKHSKYAEDEESSRKLQSQYVKSQIWATRALLLTHASRQSDALSAVEHAIQEAPECPSLALVAKGDILTMGKAPAEDIYQVYLKAIEHDPNSEFAHLSLIHLLLSNGEGREALKFSSKLAQLADDGYLLNPRLAIEVHASILFHLANYDAAYKLCLAHLPPQNSEDDRTEDSEDPYHIRLLNIVAQSLHQQGKCEEAQSFFDRALRPDPMNVYTWNEKGRCLLQSKRFDDALNYFDRALVLNPEDIRSICNRALCLCLLGNVSQGAEILIEHEKGGNHSVAAEWLQSLSPTERAFHFDSMTAARELKKRRDREAISKRDQEQAQEEI